SLHAQLGALDFYLKNGYKAVGPVFEEAGIQHITAEKFFSKDN
ncbi:MAG: GNAT family N-acetyltransferase, partial [Streptococcus parasanguinis]|nr:GNAT family N-acetyltransferase [Streptococcus parasanguinis]